VKTHSLGARTQPTLPVNTTPLAAAILILSSAAPAAAADYGQQVEAARAERVAELTKPDGWLTLIGLHFLQLGANTIGRANDNQIVLAAGPSHLGTAALSADGKVTFAPAPGADAKIDGQTVGVVDLRVEDDDAKPTVVTSGTVSFFLIKRGEKVGLRVKDTEAAPRKRFVGLDYFPTDPAWRIEASWVPFDPPREMPITNILGNVSLEKVPGKAVFQSNGRTYELFPVLEGPDQPLFFIFSDATGGKGTYHMRFLDAESPKSGKVVLDFNLATNPPCAFTPFATCPLPPKENRLTLAVTAGEKIYRGDSD
jgi:uncharacterized protein